MIKRDMISAWRVRGRRVINLLIWGSAVAAMVYWAGWGITACALIILLVYEGSRWGFSRVVCKGAVIKYDWFYKPFIGWFWDDAEGTDNCKGWKRCGSCLAGSAGLLLLAGLTRLELVFGLGKLGNFYIALILVSLLNLIPFPIFDGGRCLISVFSRGTWSGHIAAVLLLSVAFFACWGVNPLHACLSSALSFLRWIPLINQSVTAGVRLKWLERVVLFVAWSVLAGIAWMLFLEWFGAIPHFV